MPKPTSAASGAAALPMHVVLVTMDSHLASAAARANRTLAKAMPGLRLSVHAAAESAGGPPQVEGGPPHFVNGMFAEVTVVEA